MTAPSGSRVRAGDGFALRTPALPMTLHAWAAADDARAYLARILDDPAVREALFVASPNLSDAIASWRAAPTSAAGQRVEHSLVKYLSRMMGRATPFGLFSAMSTGRLGRDTDLALAPRAAYVRRTRLDNDYLFVLADQLARTPDARAALTYRPSSSLYRVAGRIRYAAAHVAGTDRTYQLISVDATPYLDATLALAGAPAGATRAALAAPLVGDEITDADATAYIDELIDAQILVPELGIHVTGPSPLDGLLGQLRAAGLSGPHAILDDVRTRLAAIDAGGVANPVAPYTEIAALLAQLPAKVDRARLFQVDMIKPATAVVSTRLASDLARVAERLTQIIPRRDRTFDDFKRAFAERYEGREVPLAEALDEESGIGFESVSGPGSEGAPLLATLAVPGGAPPENRIAWTRLEQHLLRRLATALATGATEILLGDADFTALKLAAPLPLPDAFSLRFRLAQGAAPTVLFEGVSGPSGANVLGRFSYADDSVAALVRAHLAAEEALRPDAVFAEVVHLNEGRIGNILCRPVLRGHEIVFLGVSGAPREAQLGIEDLLVSVRGGRVVLTSRSLGKEVIPRLSTAHNFRLRSLGMYRFLCALGEQGVSGVGWSWGVLASAPYLPRVRIGDILVARARWSLDGADLVPVTEAVRAARKEIAKQPAVLAAVATLRAARGLPRMFAVAQSDNELPVDLDNPLLAAAFADEISGRDAVELVELFPAADASPVHGPEGSYANEIVLTYTQTREVAAAAPVVAAPASSVRRTFPPGSEWLYAKIYCGEATADRVLVEAIGPVARAAVAEGSASQWFFLRYTDPAPHLRVRFRGEPGALLGSVLPALGRALEPLTAVGAVRNLVLDSYVRETERYGGDAGIELVEQLFWRDSEAVLGIVELLEGAEGATARWKLALRGIDAVLELLGLPPAVRAEICKEGRDRIGAELGAGTPLWAQIGERFTRERADLDAVFARDPGRDAEHDLEPGFALLAARDLALAPIVAELRARDEAGRLAPRIRDLAWSVGHMHANRMLHASQRAQEMVLYDFLNRLHASRRARARG